LTVTVSKSRNRRPALDLADDWCRGYTLGIALREDEWKGAMEAPELQEVFLPILAIAHPEHPDLDPIENSEKYRAMLDVLPNCAVEIYE
jgi:yecA family protein